MPTVPIQITFRGLDRSEAIEADIRRRLEWLESFAGRILDCRVRVELRHRHRHRGRTLAMRITLSVPGGGPLVVNEASEISRAHYAGAVVKQAFDTMRRRLQDFAREQRGDVKSHTAA